MYSEHSMEGSANSTRSPDSPVQKANEEMLQHGLKYRRAVDDSPQGRKAQENGQSFDSGDHGPDDQTEQSSRLRRDRQAEDHRGESAKEHPNSGAGNESPTEGDTQEDRRVFLAQPSCH